MVAFWLAHGAVMVRVVRCWVLIRRPWFGSGRWKLIVCFNDVDVQLAGPYVSVFGNDLPVFENVVVFQ